MRVFLWEKKLFQQTLAVIFIVKWVTAVKVNGMVEECYFVLVSLLCLLLGGLREN